MIYYNRHLGDYAKNTGHLNVIEHGMYNLLLDRYYTTEKPIPAKEAHKVCKADLMDEQESADRILREFFVRKGKVWTNPRCDEEIAKFHAKSDKAKGSANKRWQCERNANAMPRHSEGNAIQYPISNIQDKEKNSERLKTLIETLPDLSRHSPSQRQRIAASKT